MGAHQYWRLLISSENGAHNTVVVYELKMFDASGNSLCSGGAASASSTYGGIPGTYDPSKAFDGNDTTWWNASATPTGGSPQWLKYAFAAPVDVATFLLEGADSASPTQNPMNFKLQYNDTASDVTGWVDASPSFNPVWSQWSRAYSFPLVAQPAWTFANWRLKLNTTVSVSGFGLAEVQLRIVSGGANVASGGLAFAQDVYSGNATYAPGKAFDGNAATFWTGASATEYLGYALPKAQQVIEVTLQSRPDGSYNQGPLTFDVQGSNDGGATWQTVASLTAAAWTSSGQTQTFAFNGNTSPPSFGSNQFPSGIVGVPYSAIIDLAGSGVAQPITFTKPSGAYPDGLSLSSDAHSCTLSGVPLAPGGTFTFTLRCANTYGYTEKEFTVTISPLSSIPGAGGNYGWSA